MKPLQPESLGFRVWLEEAADALPEDSGEAYQVHDNPNDSGNLWVYESTIPANTTEPGRDGTFDRYWTPVESV